MNSMFFSVNSGKTKQQEMNLDSITTTNCKQTLTPIDQTKSDPITVNEYDIIPYSTRTIQYGQTALWAMHEKRMALSIITFLVFTVYFWKLQNQFSAW